MPIEHVRFNDPTKSHKLQNLSSDLWIFWGEKKGNTKPRANSIALHQFTCAYTQYYNSFFYWLFIKALSWMWIFYRPRYNHYFECTIIVGSMDFSIHNRAKCCSFFKQNIFDRFFFFRLLRVQFERTLLFYFCCCRYLCCSAKRLWAITIHRCIHSRIY